MGTTITRLFSDSVTRYADGVAYTYKRDGQWQELTYGAADALAARTGAGLIALGIGKGDRVAILANSRLEWSIVDWAALGAGAIVVPIYQTSSASECEYILGDSGARLLIVEDAEQLAKVNEARGNIAALEKIVVIDPTGVDTSPDNVITLEDLQQLPAGGDTERWRESLAAVEPDDLATFIYTSGTTGPPKGCMITHDNYAGLVDQVVEAGLDFVEDDRIILFLPLAHNFARLIQFVAFRVGGTLAFSTIPTIMDDLAEVKPTILPSVPRVFEKAHARIGALFGEATGVKAKLISWAMGVGARRGKYLQHSRRVPPGLAAQYALASKLVLGKVQARFGGNIRFCVSGGAPLSREVQEFFLATGLVILEGYGLTETTSALTVNRPTSFRAGSVGLALPRTELKTAEDGELLARGPQVFRGYYNNQEATAEVLDEDGWLRTGDIATVDRQGFVYITDRKKDIIVTAGGKNIAPQNIENALKATPMVSQALVYGDRKPYLTALITVDEIELGNWASAHGHSGEELGQLVKLDEVQALVREAVDKVNSDVGRVEQVKRYRIMPVDFTVESEELTPTLKLKRKVVTERYRELIEEMYEPDASEVAAADAERVTQLQNPRINA